MRKLSMLFLSGIVLCAIVGCGAANEVKHPYVQEYTPGEGNIQGNVDVDYFLERDERFAIGADEDGMAVFKNPDEAFDALVENYSAGIALIQEEYDLEELTREDYTAYSNLGWQVTTGTPEEKEQAAFVSGFFDIYENSY